MLVKDFDYHLPEGLIAYHPAPRGDSRLLVLDAAGAERHRQVRDLPRLLRPGDLLVVNDTRVLPARIFARRYRQEGGEGAVVELLLVERRGPREWEALVKPGRKARPGSRLVLPGEGEGEAAESEIEVEVVEILGDGRRLLRFSTEIEPYLERAGHVPLPPYVKRPDEAADRELYQTVFARHAGAIAAPTAGLHFSEELLDRLAEAGVRRAAVTLHVGIGTFKPVTADLVHEHRMDAERYEVSRETADAIRRTREAGGRVVAVGTTVVRTLESAALAVPEGSEEIVQPGSGRTELFIRPGFVFRAVDVLLTNFHLPRSTLLMLVSAFAGRERVLAAYEEAIAAGYRFYSYGDAMLVERLSEGRSAAAPG